MIWWDSTDVRVQWVQFWSENGNTLSAVHFDHSCLESGMAFERTTGVYELINRFNSKLVRKKEKYANSKWIEEFVCLRSNRLRTVSCFSLQNYCTRNLSTRAAKPGAARNENNVVVCSRTR